MKELKEKYLLPQRVSPTQVELYEVKKEVYEAKSKEINRLRKQAQRNGECSCTKNKLWQCDGCCVDCPFYHKKAVSLDDVAYKDDKGENDLTYEEITPDETFENTADGIMFKVLVDELKEKLESIDPKTREIFDAIYEKVISKTFESLRKVADEMGIKWPTFYDKLVVIREWTEEYLKK